MKTLNVVAAVLEKDGKILIAQRKKGEFAGLWEFPGGKVEAGEGKEHAIVREIHEEFDIKIGIKSFLTTVEHQYESFYLVMDCFVCYIEAGDLIMHDHTAYKWIDVNDEITGWVPADIKVINRYKEYINNDTNANSKLSAQLVCNNPEKKTKVLNELTRFLNRCDSFSFSVAFISDSGLQCIKQSILDLAKKGKKGRFITSTYLGFNNPKIFKELLKLENISVRIFEQDGFHPKGYIFSNASERNIIIGSSNITDSALTVNQEWNICLNSNSNETVVERIENEFEEQWSKSIPLTYEWINNYEKVYRKIEYQPFINSNDKEDLKPNLMQTEALNSLNCLRSNGKGKALLISATGTGKTFLSAFDVKQFNAKRILFVVHRENIAKKALESFKLIMPDKTYGMYSGNVKDVAADYIFSTIQTIGKEEHIVKFKRNAFDYIIIDEVHHLGAESYQILFNYFKPAFLLGMTATPERTDGYDIYKDFDYNIAYEIRLQQAMEENLLCPFHYFGVSDFEIDGIEINEDTDINYLTCEERVKHIINAANTYSYSGDKVHGLIFVSRVEEAKRISAILNTKGYKTESITGENYDVEHAIDLLEADDGDYYDYLVCIDKFNEGIDIPKVNQIIMARPTNSPIIFVQQLGRGLRKAVNKDYTVIIDLIGNYKRNYMIPLALSGDRTYNVDTINRYMISGKQFLPGTSTIYFDEVARERIFNSLERINGLNDIIKKSYETLQFKIGRRPYLIDFYNEKEVDPLLIVEKYKSYYGLLTKLKDVKIDKFSDEQGRCLAYLSKLLLNGKRNIEIALLEYLILNKRVLSNDLFEYLKKTVNCSNEQFDSSITYLSGGFETTSKAINENKDFLIINYDDLHTKLTDQFSNWLLNDEFKKEIEDLLKTGNKYYLENYSKATSVEPFIVSKKYSRSDVARLTNSNKNECSTMYGMYAFKNNVYIFVTYKKTDPTDEKNYVDGKPDYADCFVDEQRFEWMTQIGRGIDSSYYKDVVNAENRFLFIQKNSGDSDFYYMGKVDIIKSIETTKKDNSGKTRKIVNVSFLLDRAVENELLEYFNSYDHKTINNDFD